MLLATFTIIDILLRYNTFCLCTSVFEINRKKHVFLHAGEKWCKKEHLTLLTEAKLQTDFTHVIIHNSPSLSPHWCMNSLHYFMSFANSIYTKFAYCTSQFSPPKHSPTFQWLHENPYITILLTRHHTTSIGHTNFHSRFSILVHSSCFPLLSDITVLPSHFRI